MTNNETQNPIRDLNSEIANLAQQFGRAKLLLALLKAIVRVKSQPPDADQLDNRLRRDMGLPERVADPIDLFWGMKR